MLHGEFEASIDLAASVDRVWAAFADPAERGRWARIPGGNSVFELDFRAEGLERVAGTFAPSGRSETIESVRRFADIDEPRRIISMHRLSVDDVLRWVSLVTVSLDQAGERTRVTHHEQYVLTAWSGDGADDRAHLAGATRLSLNRLSTVVE